MTNAEHINTGNDSSPGDLEDALFDNLEPDTRFQNGVSTASPGDELDFINMTGLTPVRRVGDDERPSANDAAMDPEAPVSFFEEGVGDVDSRMAPNDMNIVSMDDDELVPSVSTTGETESKTVAGLKEIIADLSGDDSVESDKSLESHDGQAVSANLDALTELNLEAASSALDDLGNSAPSEDLAPPSPLAAEDAAVPYDFQEAGELIRTLEEGDSETVETRSISDQADADTSEDFNTEESSPVAVASTRKIPDEQDTSVYNRPLKQSSSLRKRKRPRLSSRMVAWGIRLVFLLVIAGSGYYMWQLYQNRSLNPSDLYALATSQAEAREFGSASATYAALVRRYPNDPLRSDAEFMEPYALYLIPESAPNSDEAYTKAAALFELFLVDNPSHQKAARAETLLGMLYYRMGRYTDAISRLADPNRRLRDPGSYLPVMRTLARSYAAEGQIEKARSAFLQAAVLDSNFEPDRDYLELATLYMTLAERDGNTAMARRYYSQAVEQWNHALRIPGLLVSQRKEIKAAREVLQSRLMLEDDMVSSREAQDQAASPEFPE